MKQHLLQQMLFCILAVRGTHGVAQYTYDWVKQFGGGQTEWGNTITTDNNGNVITGGSFMFTVDFDPDEFGVAELSTVGNDNGFICKLDAAGNYLWATSIEGESNVRAIATDSEGYVYAAGTFQGSVDFDAGSGEVLMNSNGANDAFLAKYSPGGEVIWVKSFGGQNHDGVVAMDTSENGTIAVCGYFVYTVDFDPGAGVSEFTAIEFPQQNDCFISQFDLNGNFQWVHVMGGASIQSADDVAFDEQGNVICTGRFGDYINCDPGVSDFTLNNVAETTATDAYIVKLDSDGGFHWAKQLGGQDNDGGTGIAADADGNIYSSGYFGLTADFDPGSGAFELMVNGVFYDIYISKLDADGNFVWARQMGSSANDGAESIAVDSAGNVYTTGHTGGICDLDPGEGVANFDWEGEGDIFISVLDPNGEYLWGENFGAFAFDMGTEIAVDESHIYVTGEFSENLANFGDFDLNAAGNDDAFVFKLTHPIAEGVNNPAPKPLHLFPNPTSDLLHISGISTSATVTITDCSGKEIVSEKINGHQPLNISALQNGIYFILIEENATTLAAKLLVAE
ncbi:MAG: SBBP repeat-containing protein [Flavobacteriales bacterium]|nr:SBBP repeat-containing protein [Flavobacteriales bacterium]